MFLAILTAIALDCKEVIGKLMVGPSFIPIVYSPCQGLVQLKHHPISKHQSVFFLYGLECQLIPVDFWDIVLICSIN